jgi:hypothetical protein
MIGPYTTYECLLIHEGHDFPSYTGALSPTPIQIDKKRKDQRKRKDKRKKEMKGKERK